MILLLKLSTGGLPTARFNRLTRIIGSCDIPKSTYKFSILLYNEIKIFTLPSKQVFSRNAPIHPVKPIIKVIPPEKFKFCITTHYLNQKMVNYKIYYQLILKQKLDQVLNE